MASTKEDLGQLMQQLPTGKEGVKGLVQFSKEGNSEVRDLLYNECEVLLECRFCRNIFRSVINFISHKRSYCRASFVTVVAEGAVATSKRKRDREVEEEEDEESDEDVEEDEDEGFIAATKKRTGQMGMLSKRLQPTKVSLYTLPRITKELPVTTLENGFQKIVGALPNFAHKVKVQDKVLVTMPADYSSNYKEMLLRQRKNPNEGKTVEFSSSEMKILDNFERHNVRVGDFVLLQCDHPACTHVKPFHSLNALAYHCSLRHTQAFTNDSGDERWPCLLCNRHMWSLDGVHTHLHRVHPTVKEEHVRMRKEDDKRNGKKAYKRCRSLSIDSDHGEKEAKVEEEEVEEEDVQENMIIEEEEPRGRRRGARAAAMAAAAAAAAAAAPPPHLRRQAARGHSEEETQSDEFESPPVLKPANGTEEQHEDADGFEERDASASPDSSREKEEENNMRRNEMDSNEEKNPVEACLDWLVAAVCLFETNEKKKEQERRRTDNIPTEEPENHSIVQPQLRSCPSKRRGRPKKSGMEERNKEVAKSDNVRPKRTYGKKTEKEMQEEREGKEGSQATEGGDAQQAGGEAAESAGTAAAAPAAAAAATASRPSRDRKRPRWMMDEAFDESIHAGAPASSNSSQEQSQIANGDEEVEKKSRKENDEEYKRKDALQPIVPAVGGTPLKNKGLDPETLLYTPRSGSAVMERIESKRLVRRQQLPADSTAAADDGTMGSIGSRSKRKQNLVQLVDDDDDAMIVAVSDPMTGPKRSDLSSVPVYLSEQQQKVFFAGMMHRTSDSSSGKKEYFECSYCSAKMPNIRDGRRHMVAHIRVMRLRCGLCSAGAFFCIDMRNHLQLRGCPELTRAPAHMLRPGTPCMTKQHADELTYVAHPTSPGRALFTSGKIVSILRNVPYVPDHRIEEAILGPMRVPPPNMSPRKPQLKLVAAAATSQQQQISAAMAAASEEDAMPVLPVQQQAAALSSPLSSQESAGVPQQRQSAIRALTFSTPSNNAQPAQQKAQEGDAGGESSEMNELGTHGSPSASSTEEEEDREGGRVGEERAAEPQNLKNIHRNESSTPPSTQRVVSPNPRRTSSTNRRILE